MEVPTHDLPLSRAGVPDVSDSFFLDTFVQGDVLYRSPTAAFRGWAHPNEGLACSAHDYSAAVAGLAQQLRGAHRNSDVIFGAIPFSRNLPGHFFVPRQVAVSPSADRSGRAGAASPQELSRSELPGKQGYVDAVSEVLERIERGTITKVVLARALDIVLTEPLSYPALLAQLLADHGKGYTFAMPVPAAAAQEMEMLVGASPELLARRQGDRITVNPLAGSSARLADPLADAAAAKALSVSSKDRYEHAIVVDDIRRRLAPLCSELSVPEAPSVIGTDTLWHLSTEISGILKTRQTSALDVALALHPTPAICGYPTQEAAACIDELEPFARGFFAGLVGWQNVDGEGEWAIALRCAQVAGRHLRLFAGAGVVDGSDPVREYEETATKLSTLLRALSASA